MNTEQTEQLPGNNRLIGQHKARRQVQQIFDSGRISHAYLFTGPPGVGKLPLALSFAELLTGIEHLTSGISKTSQKSSWFAHPDIHVFVPMPSNHSAQEYSERIQLLAEDPYEIVDFGLRPSIDGNQSSNKQAFYAINYFRNEIRKSCMLKPNEADKTIVIITEVEKMRAETANAFLKILEEPGSNVMFLLTTNNVDALIPTILSRCQIIPLSPLRPDDIQDGLQRFDNLDESDAQYLARVSGGNYSITRFYKVDDLKEHRKNVINYLRASYTLDAEQITEIASEWHSNFNLQGHVSILNMLEVLVRDIAVYMHTGESHLLTNLDQLEVIQKFCEALGKARLEEMQKQIDEMRSVIFQNINARLAFITLATRLSPLMKGKQMALEQHDWFHIPSVISR